MQNVKSEMSYEELQIEREKVNMEEMSGFQKEVITMLKYIGYTYKYNSIYTRGDTTVAINVSYINTIEDLFLTAFTNGAQEEIWKIKRVLQINS